jgi:plastocyanin
LRKLFVPAVVVALLVPAGPALAASITVGDNYFVRDGGVPVVRVSKGEKVKWVWRGKSVHNVKVTKGPAKFGSPTQKSGSFSKRVKKKGTYTLICTVHGASDQSMKLVVR